MMLHRNHPVFCVSVSAGTERNLRVAKYVQLSLVIIFRDAPYARMICVCCSAANGNRKLVTYDEAIWWGSFDSTIIVPRER